MLEFKGFLELKAPQEYKEYRVELEQKANKAQKEILDSPQSLLLQEAPPSLRDLLEKTEKTALLNTKLSKSSTE